MLQEYLAVHHEYTDFTLIDSATVVDGITGSTMDVTQQAVNITMMAHDQKVQRNETKVAAHPHPWTAHVDLKKIADVHQLATVICQEPTNPRDGIRLFTIVAAAGAGKTWLVKQALNYLVSAYQQKRQHVAACITVQSIAFELARQDTSEGSAPQLGLGDFGGDLMEWYLSVKYTSNARFRSLLLDAYHSRRLVLILDGLDEAPNLKDTIQEYLCGPLVLSGTKVIVTSRPEGIRTRRFRLHGYVQFSLELYSDDQQRAILRRQLLDDGERSPGRFMKNLLDYLEAKREFDNLYRAKVPDKLTRMLLEGMSKYVPMRSLQTVHREGVDCPEPVASADELLSVAAQSRERIFDVLRRIANKIGLEVFEAADDLKAMGMVGLLLGPTKKKERINSKAAKYPDDEHPYSKIIDVLRCKYVCESTTQMRCVVDALESAPGVTVVRLKNYFAEKDEINFRRLAATVRIELEPTLSHCVEVQIHLRDLYVFREERADLAYKPYVYFRSVFSQMSSSGGWVQLDAKLEAWSGFLNIPVVMSMFVVVLQNFDWTNPRLHDLPSNKADMYHKGLKMIVKKKITHLTAARSSAQSASARCSGGAPLPPSDLKPAPLDHRYVSKLLAVLAFANHRGGAGGKARRQFSLEHVREAIGIGVANTTWGAGDTADLNLLAQLEHLLFDFDSEDSYRIPTLKILESGGADSSATVDLNIDDDRYLLTPYDHEMEFVTFQSSHLDRKSVV